MLTRTCATLLILAAALFGCGPSGQPDVVAVSAPPAAAPAALPAKPHASRVALVMKTLTNPFFIEMEKGARRAEKEFAIELQVKTAAQETSIEQQIQIVEDLIRDKVDAIVIAPGDSRRLTPVLKKAQDAGIKVVNIDNALDQDAMKAEGMVPPPFISVDNERAAYASARFIADQVKGPAEAAIIEGIAGADNARQRQLGAERAFVEHAGVKIVARQTANWKIDEGYEVAKQIFAKHPKVKLLFCANDMMALGALKYLQEAKRTDVLVAGYDALDEAREAVSAGRMMVTVDQRADEQGYQGVRTALSLMKGETPGTPMLVDTHLVTAKPEKVTLR